MSADIRAIHPTADGMVHLTVDGRDYLMMWPDALRLASMIQAMSASAAMHVGAEVEVFQEAARNSWNAAFVAAHEAEEWMSEE